MLYTEANTPAQC